MSHFKWISALELNLWADMVEARGLLPRLVRMLVQATVENSDLERVNFPGDEETHRPGADGETKVKRGNSKVPEGIAYWEMGTDKNVKGKLDADFNNRIDKRGTGNFKQAAYVAVTPRDYHKKSEWVEEKEALGQWREVRVYDSDDLEQWLELAPAVGRWLLQSVSKIPVNGVTDIRTHWENLQTSLKKKLPTKAFLAGRHIAVESFNKWVNGPANILAVAGQSIQEVVDAFSAWVCSLPESEQYPITSRAIIVDRVDIWKNLANLKHRLILICSDRLEFNDLTIAEATRNGHHVLLPASPFCSHLSGAIKLERLDRRDLQNALHESGLTEDESVSLARHSGGSLCVLRRRFSRFPHISKPAWAQDEIGPDLAPLLLAGSWNDANVPDQEIVSRLADTTYSNVRRVVACWRSESDSPLRWVNGTWYFVSPLDAWPFLGALLSPAQLATFAQIAKEVLGVDDPRLELPPGERWLANLKGKNLAYSWHLRKGIAQSMAMLALGDEDGYVADSISLQDRINRIVSDLLPVGVSWKRWASLGRLLPVLAESAPDKFLDAVETSLEGDATQIVLLFDQETDGILGGGPEHTGLLWALERLAWSRELLPRVTLVLARLATLDKGGRWLNRPKVSLTEIYCLQVPQTTASIESRVTILRLVQERFPQFGWELLLKILPHGAEAFSFTDEPEWRFWREGWVRGASNQEYWQSVESVLNLVLAILWDAPAKWTDFIPYFTQLHVGGMIKALEQFEAITGSELSETDRIQLWRSLCGLINRQQYYSGAHWCLPLDVVARLAAVQERLKPSDPVSIAAQVFSLGFCSTGHHSLSWEEQERIRVEQRSEAMRAVIDYNGLDGVLQLVRQAKDISDIAYAFFEITKEKFGNQIIPALLCTGEKEIDEFARVFAQYRVWNDGERKWAENLPFGDWQTDQVGIFLSQFPSGKRTWDFVSSLGAQFAKSYWEKASNLPGNMNAEEVEFAARKLIEFGRPIASIDLIAMAVNNKREVLPGVLLELFEKALSSKIVEPKNSLDPHEIHLLLAYLQKTDSVDKERLARLEWALVPILDNGMTSPQTLHEFLSAKPEFFLEVLAICYKSRHGNDDSESQDSESEPNKAERKIQAKHAWHLLHGWHRLPGTQPDGGVDCSAIIAWIQNARTGAAAIDRLEVCDSTIGQVLAYAPPESDGSWPCIAVREILETVVSAELLRGFLIGIANRRGGYMKAHNEGGRQERDLAEKYEKFAEPIISRWPRTAKALRQVADDYRQQARREDTQAEAHALE